MQKLKIVELFDKLFVGICVFLLLYAWLNFYLRNLWLTFVLSLIFCFAIMFIFNYVSSKRKQKKNLTKQTEKEIDKNFYAFKLTPTKQKLELINKIIKKTSSTTLMQNAIYYVSNNKTCLITFATNVNCLTQNDLLNVLQNFLDINVDEIQIVCEKADKNLQTEIFLNKSVQIINKAELYTNFFKKTETYPDTSKLNFERKKLTIKQIILNLFAPEKAKGYFFCGLVLVFSSIILPFHVYYLVFGSVLLMFSIMCKLKTFSF